MSVSVVSKCSHLRCKSAFGIYGDSFVHLEEVMGATTSYWCLRTMGKSGPDEHYVHGSLCRSGRECFEGSQEDDE